MNMNAKEFVNSIYLGDRACKKVVIDSWNERCGIQVDCISRLKSGSDSWNYYIDEDIINGWLVFSELGSISILPNGPVPNDSIDILEVRENGEIYEFDISIGSGDDKGNITDVRFKIKAKDISIETNETFLESMKD